MLLYISYKKTPGSLASLIDSLSIVLQVYIV